MIFLVITCYVRHGEGRFQKQRENALTAGTRAEFYIECICYQYDLHRVECDVL